MTAWIGLAKFVLLTASLFAVATAILIRVAYPRLRPRLARMEPARRAHLVTLLSMAPVAVATLHTTLCFVPGVVGSAFPTLDHCTQHAHGDHPHLCFVHLPGGTGTVVGWVIAAAALAAVLVPTIAEARRLLQSRRLLAAVVNTADRGVIPGTLVVDSDVPFAAATPLSEQVLLSSRLLSGLAPELLQAVVEHERAHVRRRDPLRRTVARLLSVVHLPMTRRALGRDLELACEQACDEQAGQRSDRLTVARALLAVERLLSCGGVPALGSLPARFAGSNVVRRVEALLDPPLPRSRSWVERNAIPLLILASAVLTDPIHHAAEVIVGLVA